MKNEFVVLKAAVKDIPEIQAIIKEAFSMYAEAAGISEDKVLIKESVAQIRHAIETQEVFVAHWNGIIVGSVRIDVKEDNTAYLSRFAVGSAYQNYGVGKALMNAVDEAMTERGVTTLYLHTASKVKSLVGFYYGRGFYIDSTSKDRGYIRALLRKDYIPAEAHDHVNVSVKEQPKLPKISYGTESYKGNYAAV